MILFHSVPPEIVLRQPCICLEVSYKKTIPSPLPKCTPCSSLAERSYSGAPRAQDGQWLYGWILGTGEVGRHQGSRLQEVVFPTEEPGETCHSWQRPGGTAERLLPPVAQIAILSVFPCWLQKGASPALLDSVLAPAFSFPALFRSQPCVLWKIWF